MSYFEDEKKGLSLGAIGIFLIMLVAAVVGGFLTLTGAYYLGYLNPDNIRQEFVPPPFTGNNGDSGGSGDKILLSPGNDSVVTAVAEKVSPSVVQISNFSSGNFFWQGEQEVEAGTGSGLIVDTEGYIITNNHVVSGATRLEVTLYDGETFAAEIIGTDARTDLAVIKISGAKNISPAAFGDSDALKVGQLVIAIGNPGGAKFANSVTVGYVSGLNRMIESSEGRQYSLIQTDAAINPGNSGGPLVNANGEVVGINSIKIASNAYEGMGFSIPANIVKSVMDDLIQYKKVIRPGLGVSLIYDVTPAFAEMNQLEVEYGVIVKPLPDSGALKAGIRDYDVITAVNGKKIEDRYVLQEEILSHAIGDKVTVTVYREGDFMDIEVELGELSG
jgi:serine protease Do